MDKIIGTAEAVRSLVLSLFPGIGLLDMAFELEGYCVVRGPDVLWGGDIHRFHPPAGRFDGVIGGPPCQAFSQLAHLVRANGYEPRFGNLIPEFERCVVESQPDWFVSENVWGAPVPTVEGYGIRDFLLDNSHLAGPDGWGQEQMRLRRFTFGLRGRKAPDLRQWIDVATFVLPEARQALLSDSRAVPVKLGGSGKVKRTRVRAVSSSAGGVGPGRPEHNSRQTKQGKYRLADACQLQGLPPDFLADAPFTAKGKLQAVANGVPLPMGRAVARAIKEATTSVG